MPEHSDFVTLADLDLVGTDNDGDPSFIPVSISVSGDDVTLSGNDITNEHLKTCLILGSGKGWGQAVRTTLRANVFHDCGDPRNGMLDHAVYAENAVDTVVTDNIFANNQGWAIHLYPDSQRAHVHHNVMVANGGGVIFAGSRQHASSGARVEHNVISGSRRDFNIGEWWDGAAGRDNVADSNCVWQGSKGNVSGAGRGFTATGNVTADPRYVDAAAGDYRLAGGSQCLAVVGYDIAARQSGRPAAQPAPAPAAPQSAAPATQASRAAAARPPRDGRLRPRKQTHAGASPRSARRASVAAARWRAATPVRCARHGPRPAAIRDPGCLYAIVNACKISRTDASPPPPSQRAGRSLRPRE